MYVLEAQPESFSLTRTTPNSAPRAAWIDFKHSSNTILSFMTFHLYFLGLSFCFGALASSFNRSTLTIC